MMIRNVNWQLASTPSCWRRVPARSKRSWATVAAPTTPTKRDWEFGATVYPT